MIDTYFAKQFVLRRVAIGLMIVAGLAAGILLYNVDPSTTSIYPRCSLYSLTGLHCPGCGATRALHALLHGRIGDALRFNSLFVIGIPGVVALAYWQGRPTSSTINKAKVARTIAVLLVAYTLARNIPYPPFEFLAPHAAEHEQE